MNEGSGALVFLILVPLFMAVGLYLIWFSRRRKNMLEAFAKTHQLRLRPEHAQELHKTLESCFSLDEGLVRNFGQISSLVDGESVWLFRAVELLDLNPSGQSDSTHVPRIVAFFDIPLDHDEFFLLDRSMQARQLLPRSRAPRPEVTAMAKRLAMACKARHPLSVTLAHGHRLIYFEPLITAGETIRDVNSLYCIAQHMGAELSRDV